MRSLLYPALIIISIIGLRCGSDSNVEPRKLTVGTGPGSDCNIENISIGSDVTVTGTLSKVGKKKHSEHRQRGQTLKLKEVCGSKNQHMKVALCLENCGKLPVTSVDSDTLVVGQTVTVSGILKKKKTIQAKSITK